MESSAASDVLMRQVLGREAGHHDVGAAGGIAVLHNVSERDGGRRVGYGSQPQVLDVCVEDDVVRGHVGPRRAVGRLLEVAGRFDHGDGDRYQGGVGAVHVGVREVRYCVAGERSLIPI